MIVVNLPIYLYVAYKRVDSPTSIALKVTVAPT